MHLWALALLVAGYIISSEGRIVDQCEQVQSLRGHGVPDDQMPDWLCLIQHESEGNTQAQNTNNVDGSWDWGIFQINDRYWCGRDGPGGGCNIACNSLMDDDINNDIDCALEIWRQMKFPAWVAWNNYCQGEKPPAPQC